MSGVVKSVGKVFKKVAKAVVKIAPVALLAGAVLLTGGAALGLTPALAGMAGTIGTSLGGTGVLGSVLTGAITQAGYGAMAGGAMSLVKGENIIKGARSGAALGAVSGGISGGFSAATAGSKIAGQAGGTAATQGGGNVVTHGIKSTPPGVTEIPFGGAGQQVGKTVTQNVPEAAGGLFAKGGWLERNQPLVGNVVAGLGQGLTAGAKADAQKDLLREDYRQVRRNYEGTDPGRGLLRAAEGTSTQTPTQRFDPAIYGEFEYQYNPASGRIERVAVQGA